MSDHDNNGASVPALPDDYVKQLMSGIADSRAQTIVAGGKPFFRLLKSGKFVFGQTNEEMQPGSRWVVNIRAMTHGYSCWVDGVLEGEVMVPMTQPLPRRPDPIDGVPFKDQRGMEMRCYDGDDQGVEVLYKINSTGGIRAIAALLTTIYDQLARRPAYPCPVLRFTSESYQHKKHGEIATPTFHVVGWANMNGDLDEGDQPSLPLQQAAPAPAPARKRKAPLGEAPAAPETPAQPVASAQTHIGQRRRPSAA